MDDVDWYCWRGTLLETRIAHPDVRRFVRQYLAGFACSDLREPRGTSTCLVVTPGSAESWQIRENTDCQVVTERDLLPVTDLVIRRWLAAATQAQPGWQVFHGACLVYQGKGFGVLGESGAGKSTFAMAWYGSGRGVLSDEYCLLDSVGNVHLYPRPWEISDHLDDPLVQQGIAACDRFGYPYWRPEEKQSLAQYFVPQRRPDLDIAPMVAWLQLGAAPEEPHNVSHAAANLLVQYPVYRVARRQPISMVAEVVHLLEKIA